MEIIDFTLKGEWIALDDLLKLTGVAPSGGAAKHRVAQGEVTVDAQPESRKRAKIRAGQTVRVAGEGAQAEVSIRVAGATDGPSAG